MVITEASEREALRLYAGQARKRKFAALASQHIYTVKMRWNGHPVHILAACDTQAEARSVVRAQLLALEKDWRVTADHMASALGSDLPRGAGIIDLLGRVEIWTETNTCAAQAQAL